MQKQVTVTLRYDTIMFNARSTRAVLSPGNRTKLCKFRYVKSVRNFMWIAALPQRWPRNAPYTWVPWKISGLPDYAHGYYSQNFSWAFKLFRSTLWMFVQNFKSVALPFPEIIGVPCTQKNGAAPGYGHAPFPPKFLTGFYSEWPCKYIRQIWSL